MMKRKYNLGRVFSIVVFLILFIATPVSILLNHFLPFDFTLKETPLFRLAIPVLLCSLAGTIASKIIGKKTIDTITEIDTATKEIASGNYNVRIDETSHLVELSDMAKNFNLMARDLAMNDMMKNDFINNVSHDFKTPLSVIEGYAKLLANKELPPQKVEEYATSILLTSKRLSKMTGNILLLSTLDNSRADLKKTSFSLDEHIREMILLYQTKWDEKDIKLQVDLEELAFYGDQDLLSHVWQNLISNAVKFCNEGGSISVSLSSDGDKVKIAVTNTGAFIKKEEIANIFEKFYQGDVSRTSNSNGLGLSIVKKVIDLHEGKIEVVSKECIGTTFTVVLQNKLPL